MILTCNTCSMSFFRKRNRGKKMAAKYCSNKCMGIAYKKLIRGENHPQWLGGKLGKVCSICGSSFYIGKYRLNTAKCCSVKCARFSQAQAISGVNHHRWNNGITPEHNRVRNSKQMRDWRVNVFRKDDFTCKMPYCAKRGGNLQAHHILSFSKFKDSRFDIKNGVTLCVPV